MVIECVPNVSEGRDPKLLAELEDAVQAVRLLHRTSDPDHNRTVFTFAGPPDAVLEAALQLAGATFERISLCGHTGVHPRIGVLDVLPFVPLSEASLADCVALANRAALAIWERWQVPSYFYEAAGSRPLEMVRRNQGNPDTGIGRHQTAGAVAIGARRVLVAWNIWLASSDLAAAKLIAKQVRAFPGVKALGLPLESRKLVQVSVNSTDFELTPLQTVFDTTESLAAQSGIAVLGSELIGLIPKQACGPRMQWLNWEPGLVLETALQWEQC